MRASKDDMSLGEVLASEWTSLIVASVMTAQTVSSQLSQLGSLGPGMVAAGIVVALICAGSFLVLRHQIARTASVRAQRLTGGITLLTSLLLLPLSGWSMVGLGVAAILLTLPLGLAGGLTLLLLGTVTAIIWRVDADPLVRVVIPTVALLVGLVLYALTRLAVTLDELRIAREHMARMQVNAERFRISRDLHDIMGRTLITASLRNQTALRLIEKRPDQARTHLEHVQEVLSQSQSQLRTITSGPSVVVLEEELASVRELCGRLGIDLSVAVDEIAENQQDLLCSAVLRESVTNMLKHSRPRRCWVSLRRESHEVVQTIINDGCRQASQGSGGTGGTGLAALGRQVAARQGTLRAYPSSDKFVVMMRLPVDVPRDEAVDLAAGREELACDY